MNKELDPILDRVNMTKQEFQSYLKNYRKAGYEEGWSECMKLWADHMTRMNTALAATKEVPWKADSQAAPKVDAIDTSQERVEETAKSEQVPLTVQEVEQILAQHNYELHGEHSGCACRWDADDNRVATCVRHQGWLDVVSEWADRAKDAEAKLAQQAEPKEQP